MPTKYAGRKMTLWIAAPPVTPLTGANATDIFTATAHGFVAGDAVVFNSLTGGAGLVTGKRYYVIAANLAANTFQVSATSGGAAFNFTTDVTAGSVSKFNQIASVTALGEAGSTRELIDASAYGDDDKDYVVGQKDGSEMELVLALDPADTGHIALKGAYDAGTKTTFGMRHVESAFDVAFPALVTAYSRGAERDGLLRATATLKILAPGVTDTP